MDIIINNQQEFDVISNTIIEHINNGETFINVILPKGTLYFYENHIHFSDMYKPKVSINFIGNGTKLTSYGTVMENGENPYVFDHSNTFLNITPKQKVGFWASIGRFFGRLFGKKYPKYTDNPSVWSELIPMNELITVEDASKKICCIRHKSIKAMPNNIGYVQVTQWFKSNVYEIVSIEDGAIYFKCNDLTYRDNKKEYSINNDFVYGKIYPRFRYTKYLNNNTLCIPNTKTMWMCINSNLLNVYKCQFDKVSFKNITVEGNNNKTNSSSLLFFDRVALNGLIIDNCKFNKIQSHCIYANDCTNIVISNNQFTNIGRYSNYISNCQNISIIGNLYKSVNTSLTNTFAIRCSGTNFYIAGNTLKDFGYGGIGAGVWYASTKITPCTGVIVENSLTDTKTELMDSGAIYLWTDNDDVVVRDNNISNYTGSKDNRGIFCDDGAMNFIIEGNHISNTPNSYSIDARRVVTIEEGVYPNSHVKRANINNKIVDNYIDGPIRFEGRDDNANCVLGDNYRNPTKEFADVLNHLDIQGKFNSY